jgi:hypothetical protein
MSKFKAGDIIRYKDHYFLITSEHYEYYEWIPLTPRAVGSRMSLHKLDEDMFIKAG